MHWCLIDAAEIAHLEGMHKEEFVRRNERRNMIDGEMVAPDPNHPNRE